jgi:hypothetical protein
MTAFLLTWKESGWPHENIVRMVRTMNEQGHVDEPWRIGAHRQAQPGDRAWVLRQGRGPKGIFGAGHLTGAPAMGDAGNGEVRWMAPVRFEAFVDPLERLLIDPDTVGNILRPAQIRAQASGYALDDEQSEALERALASGAAVELAGEGDWTPTEIEAVVADYFEMLDQELDGQAYSKSEHRARLSQVVHRSRGSIEQKRQNISAVLEILGLPWIKGYKPRENFQNALVDAIERRVSAQVRRLDLVPPAPPPPADDIDAASIFVAAPAPAEPRGTSITRVARRFDPATRDQANRALGRAGETFVMELERKRLISAGRPDLAEKVSWTSDIAGDGLGYDIDSFDPDGSRIFVEVKTTRGAIHTPFFLSENERSFAAEQGNAFRLYRLFGHGSDPKVYCLPGPLEGSVTLEPTAYRARLQAQS